MKWEDTQLFIETYDDDNNDGAGKSGERRNPEKQDERSAQESKDCRRSARLLPQKGSDSAGEAGVCLSRFVVRCKVHPPW